MATGGQFYWPSVGTFVAAYGQFFMAANKGALTHGKGPRSRIRCLIGKVRMGLVGGHP